MAILHWKIQRLSAIALIPLILYISFYLFNINSLTYSEIVYDLSSLPGIIIVTISSLILFTHSSLGIETILEDYIHDMYLQNILVSISKTIHVILFSSTIILLAIIKGI
ncbi:MAG: succinate dehydrogenase, hydrophobic membrane anchor protein [Gammaproteobacteria bacterium]|nr:succinate dehydrogenase, hydrophobic membrane anchor protein [Gammaproteobacteria bacterium]|tara:strand:- start:4911 stop:5237 length:327 start_codon:yes stop_codon:yes gene_type:complete